MSAGEQVAVTDRGRLVAYLVPAEAAPDLAWVHSVVAEGRAQWDGGRPAGLSPRLPSRGKAASRTVLDDRR